MSLHDAFIRDAIDNSGFGVLAPGNVFNIGGAKSNSTGMLGLQEKTFALRRS